MSQSSFEEQVKDLGVTIKYGARVAAQDQPRQNLSKIGSEKWLTHWAKHSHQNFPLVSKSAGVRFLAGACTGLPAFVVGAGASLDQDIEALRDAKDHAVVIAVDASYRALVANGITPDIVMTFDCKKEQQLLWESAPMHNTAMLFNTCSHPEAIQSWRGPIAFYNHFHTTDELSKTLLPAVYPHIGQIPSCGTVGNMAVFLAKLLGCTQTMLVGMDLCYGFGEKQQKQGWQYRARDYKLVDAKEMAAGKKWVRDEVKVLYDNDERVQRSYKVSWKGKDFQVDPELDFYHEVLLRFIKHYKIETINCSESGRLQTDMPNMSVTQCLETFCKSTIQAGRHVLPYLGTILKDPRDK